MSPCRLPFTSTARVEEAHRGDSADRAGDGMGLLLGAAVHPMETDRATTSQSCAGSAYSAAAVPASATARRGLFLLMGGETRPLYYPGGWQQRTTSIPDYPFVGVTLQDGRPRPSKSPHSAALQPARPSAGETVGQVPCSRRLDETKARLGRAPPGGCVAAPQSGSIRTV